MPTLPKPGEVMSPAALEWRLTVFDLQQRVQADPAFAHLETTGENKATVYFRGDANGLLAKYTADPRIDAAPAPLSATELSKISSDFMFWVNGHHFDWEHAWADPKRGTVSLGSRNPEPILAAARAEGISLDRITIYDSTPHYVPERG